MKKLLINTIIVLHLVLAVSVVLTAQTNLIFDGNFENSVFNCDTNRLYNIYYGINNTSKSWYSNNISNNLISSIYFGEWFPDCEWAFMNARAQEIEPPLQGKFMGFVGKEINMGTFFNGNYNSRNLFICTNDLTTIKKDSTYYISMFVRTPIYFGSNPHVSRNDLTVILGNFNEDKNSIT